MQLQSLLRIVTLLASCASVSAAKAHNPKHQHKHKQAFGSQSGTPAPNPISAGGVVALGSHASSSGTKHVIPKPIIVQRGQTFDCHGETYDRGQKCDNQSETGVAAAVFVVLQGGSLKNCVIGPDQSQGVRCEEGSCVFDNIKFENVCEDAITIKGNDEGETSYIYNSQFTGAIDKAVQFNGCGKLVVQGCTFVDAMKAVRSCGDCGYNSASCSRHVLISNSSFDRVGTVVAINDNYGDTATIQNNQFNAVRSVCESYKGVATHSQAPKDIGHCGSNANLKSNVVLG